MSRLIEKVGHYYNVMVSWCLWLPIFGAISATAYTVGDIPIGIFTETGSDGLGQVINDSIAKLNQQQDFTLIPVSQSVNVSNAYGYQNKLCETLQNGVFLTVGAELSTTGRSINSITETLNVPFITFSDYELYDQSRFKIRMMPSYIGVLAALAQFYHWKHIFYLYDDEAGLARYEQLHNYLNEQEVEIDLRYLDPAARSHHDSLRSFDKKYFDSDDLVFNEKVLVLDLSTEQIAQQTIDELADVGMTRDDYHLVPATLSIKNLDLTRLLYGGVTVTGFQLKGLEKTDTRKQLAIDTMQLIATAMSNLILSDRTSLYQDAYTFQGKEGRVTGVPCHIYERPWKKGTIIMQALKQAKFDGRTGRVNFDQNGYRINHTFELLQQTRQTSLQKVGAWSQNEGLKPEPLLRSRKMFGERKETGPYNQTFKIATLFIPPYFSLKNSTITGEVLEGNDKYEGYAVDLARKLAEIIGFKYEFVPVKDGQHGVKVLPNNTWNGMIGELTTGRADLAIGDLTITSARERVVDFSTPFMNLGISIMIRKPEKQKPSVFSFMEPLSNEIWMFIALSFISVSLIMFIVSRLAPAEWRVEHGPEGESFENDFTIKNSMWFVAGAIMGQGSEISPIASSGRVVGSVWWFFSLIVISSYTANLAAFLTVENIVIPINDIQDLANQSEIKFGTLNSGTTRAFFENSTNPFFTNMWQKMKDYNQKTIQEGIEKVRSSKGKYAFLFESTTNEYANQMKPCNTLKVGENLDSKNYGIATPIGHKLRHQVTMAILRLHETGELKKLKQTWWYEKGQCSTDTSGSSIKALSLSNVAGVFYILVGGLMIAMLCALMEFVIKSVKDSKKYKKSLRESMKSKARLSIAGESDDSPYTLLPRPSFKFFIEPPKLATVEDPVTSSAVTVAPM